MAIAEPTVDTGTVLHMTRSFPFPRQRVFAAFTEADQVAAWFGPQGMTAKVTDFDLRVGGRYRIEICGEADSAHTVGGEFQEIASPERLVYTWAWETGDMAGVETLVTLEFRERDGATDLVLVHERMPNESARAAHEGGWGSSFECLSDHLKGA